jgi:hypothetical protein
MTTLNEHTELDIAAFDLMKARDSESQARQYRLVCEARVMGLLGCKEEGSQSTKTTWYKITTAGSLDRALVDNYGAVLDDLPPEIFNALIKHKPTLDVRALKALATNNPDAYRIACRAIVTKPAKPSVKVELLAQTQEDA